MAPDPSVTLAIGGEACRVVFPGNARAAAALEQDLEPFVSDREPTLTFRIDMVSGLEPPSDPGWRPNRMERTEDAFVARGRFRSVRIPFDLTRVEARVLQYVQVGTVLRTGLATVLPLRGRGFLVHAAAAGNGDGVYLFPGESGAGKSTLIANSPGKRCLSEETTVVRRGPDAYEAYGFPLWARLESFSMGTDPTRLLGMFLLTKGRPQVHPVSRPRALAYLLKSVLFPPLDLDSRSRAFEQCSAFINEVPSAELVFSANPEFWRCIERG